jgi:hypothetical protein
LRETLFALRRTYEKKNTIDYGSGVPGGHHARLKRAEHEPAFSGDRKR